MARGRRKPLAGSNPVERERQKVIERRRKMPFEDKMQILDRIRKIRMRNAAPAILAPEEIARQAYHSAKIEGIEMSMDRLIEIARRERE